MEEKENYNECDLFNNPQILSLKKSLPPEFIENLRIKGESMYKNIDFETETINHVIQDSLAEILCALKAGLHPSLLETSEKQILSEEYGDEWYKKFNYVKEDLTEIFTIRK